MTVQSIITKLKYGTFSPHQTYALKVHSGLVLYTTYLLFFLFFLWLHSIFLLSVGYFISAGVQVASNNNLPSFSSFFFYSLNLLYHFFIDFIF
jgi:hypothetical protein